MKMLLPVILFFIPCFGQGQDIAIQELLYNQSLGNDKFELVNTSNTTIDVSNWWICARFNYVQLSNASQIEILEGSLSIPSGSRVKLRLISLNLHDSHSDFGLYTNTNFGSSASMHDFLQYGASDDVGRGSVAVAKGIWRDLDPDPPLVLDFIPTASAGHSADWDGSNEGGGELTYSTDFNNGPPTLPVSLLTLTGSVNAQMAVELRWIALDEINSDKHVVQRSVNGSKFENIGEVPSQNLGSTPAHYHFSDIAPISNAINYYRIRQVDFDANEYYSSIFPIHVKNDNENLFTISPMPIAGTACMTIELFWPAVAEPVTFQIFNPGGQEISLFTADVYEGFNKIAHEIKNMVPGSYVLKAADKAGHTLARQFLVSY